MKALHPDLTRRLVLETPERVPDGAGGFTTSWTPLGEIWAEVKRASGRDRASEFASVTSAQYRITLRAAPVGQPSRPRAEQRFVEGPRVFLIRAVAEADVGNRYLTCFAEEEISQ